ncbi:hypothetical protein CEXT_765731 [Caerostris extrusa]|uniref:Uncharacterized protein n=1 Tax=Caerostris extrusa TaxID=172846 RepID=A0AAV4XE36_CAEEX|nr:hypothetical protein CEXT_765731 [Caerostris extrusa]
MFFSSTCLRGSSTLNSEVEKDCPAVNLRSGYCPCVEERVSQVKEFYKGAAKPENRVMPFILLFLQDQKRNPRLFLLGWRGIHDESVHKLAQTIPSPSEERK